MSEFMAYRECIEGWVYFLMRKYLWEARFRPVIEAMRQATNEEEKKAAKAAWEEWKRVS